jgi:hypothetical protein
VRYNGTASAFIIIIDVKSLLAFSAFGLYVALHTHRNEIIADLAMTTMRIIVVDTLFASVFVLAEFTFGKGIALDAMTFFYVVLIMDALQTSRRILANIAPRQ